MPSMWRQLTLVPRPTMHCSALCPCGCGRGALSFPRDVSRPRVVVFVAALGERHRALPHPGAQVSQAGRRLCGCHVWRRNVGGVEVSLVVHPCASQNVPGGHWTRRLLFRSAFVAAELERRGGVSPHVSPLVEPPNVGNLLSNAGFAMPTGTTVGVVGLCSTPTLGSLCVPVLTARSGLAYVHGSVLGCIPVDGASAGVFRICSRVLSFVCSPACQPALCWWAGHGRKQCFAAREGRFQRAPAGDRSCLPGHVRQPGWHCARHLPGMPPWC